MNAAGIMGTLGRLLEADFCYLAWLVAGYAQALAGITRGPVARRDAAHQGPPE